MKQIIINNKPIKIDAVIFDKDGTLIEIYPMLTAIAEKRLEKLLPLTSPKIIPHYWKSIGVNPKTKKINPYGPVACAPRHEEIIVCAGMLFSCGYSYHEARKIAQTAYDQADIEMDLREGLFLIPGADKLLKSLHRKKIKIFIATSDSVGRTRKMLKILNLLKYVTDIAGSDSVKNSKPAPDAVEYIARKHKISPSMLAVCGDSVVDMQMGVNAGIKHNIAVLTGTSRKKELEKYTDLIINSVGDIKP